MIIKVCGMREPDNIRAVEELGIDWIGFIFHPKSPRYVQQVSSRAGIIPDYSTITKPNHPTSNSYQEEEHAEHSEHPSLALQTSNGQTGMQKPLRVGVFVDDMPQNIVTHVYNDHLDIVQLHGDESPVMLDNLRRTLDPDIRPGVKLMKALSVSSKNDIERWRIYQDHADYLLFDTRCPEKGGSGKKFDWNVLEAYDGDIPFLLSGGIGPDDAERVRAFRHPMCIGIDLNSRFETEPGMKDVESLKGFLEKVKKA